MIYYDKEKKKSTNLIGYENLIDKIVKIKFKKSEGGKTHIGLLKNYFEKSDLLHFTHCSDTKYENDLYDQEVGVDYNEKVVENQIEISFLAKNLQSIELIYLPKKTVPYKRARKLLNRYYKYITHGELFYLLGLFFQVTKLPYENSFIEPEIVELNEFELLHEANRYKFHLNNNEHEFIENIRELLKDLYHIIMDFESSTKIYPDILNNEYVITKDKYIEILLKTRKSINKLRPLLIEYVKLSERKEEEEEQKRKEKERKRKERKKKAKKEQKRKEEDIKNYLTKVKYQNRLMIYILLIGVSGLLALWIT